MRSVVTAGTLLAWASLGLTVDNLRRIRTPDPAARPQPESLAVLLPVRDEVEVVGACVRRLLAATTHWPGQVEVIVLDDGSSDGTDEVLRRLDGVRVVAGRTLPAGWLGKPWACHQLAEAAGDAAVLVFVDADVSLEPHALTATVDLLRSAGLDLVCPYPRQRVGGLAERLVQPLLQWSWMSTLPLALAETSSRPSMGAANGQLMAVDSTVYRRAGGHRAVRGEVLEDMALLRAVKAAGGRGVVAEGSAVASCRMYDRPEALRDGYTKSLWAAFGSPAGAVGAGLLLTVVHVVPAAAALGGSRIGVLGYAASLTSRVLVARRTGGVVADAWAHPISVLALLTLTGDSWRRRRQGTLRWKGRPVEVDPRAEVS